MRIDLRAALIDREPAPPEPDYCEGCHRNTAVQPHWSGCPIYGDAAYIGRAIRAVSEADAFRQAIVRIVLALETQRLKKAKEAR